MTHPKEHYIELLEQSGMSPLSYNSSTHRIGILGGKKTFDQVRKAVREVGVNILSNKSLAHLIPLLTVAISDEATFKGNLHTALLGVFADTPASPELLELRTTSAGMTVNINIMDIEDVFLSTPEGYRSLMDPKNYALIHRLKYEDLIQSARQVLPKYYPRNKDRIFPEAQPNGETYNIFNTYTAPNWAKEEIKNPKLPELFVKVLNHLLPISEEREYFFDWAYNSLTTRAKVYLILCGIPGSGKTALKDVLRELHGSLNFVTGKKSTLTTNFNSQLAEGTLISFDEIRYTEEEENVMKEIPNASISIERKGEDATRASEMTASLMLVNNKLRDNYLDFDARKFVPLTISSENLLTSLTHAEVDEFYNKIDPMRKTYDPDFIANIGHWILKYGKSDKWPNGEYKTPMLYKIAQSSMSRWKKKLIDLLSKEKSYPITGSQIEAKFNIATRKTNVVCPDMTTIEYFLNIYRDLGGNRVYKATTIPGNIYGDFILDLVKAEEILDEIDNSHEDL